MFKRFAFDEGKLVAAGRGPGRRIVAGLLGAAHGHRKIILYAAPGKQGFYRRLGCGRMRTAMALFEDPALAARRGCLAGEAPDG